jgi:hypothetical protein
LQACLLVYHLQYGSRRWIGEVLDSVRAQLKLAPVPELELAGELTEKFSVPFVLFLDPPKLSTGRLLWSLNASSLAGLTGFAKKVCDQLLQRDDLATAKLTRSMVLQSAAALEVEDERCFELLAEARREAVKEQRPLGELLVIEFEQRLLRGKFAGLRRLFGELQANHLENPRVQQHLYRVLLDFGLLSQDGRVRLPVEEPERAAAGGIWTPDSAAAGEPAAEIAGESTSGSKLWIPGS